MVHLTHLDTVTTCKDIRYLIQYCFGGLWTESLLNFGHWEHKRAFDSFKMSEGEPRWHFGKQGNYTPWRGTSEPIKLPESNESVASEILSPQEQKFCMEQFYIEPNMSHLSADLVSTETLWLTLSTTTLHSAGTGVQPSGQSTWMLCRRSRVQCLVQRTIQKSLVESTKNCLIQFQRSDFCTLWTA